MATQTIQQERIRRLNDCPAQQGEYVLYWMQQSQRAEDNHALEFAVRTANQQNRPLLVAFALMDDYPEATRRHYRFMLEGLQETAKALANRGIHFVLRRGHPEQVVLHLAADASTVICDRGYLRHQRQWPETVAKEAQCDVWQVESDVVVPVEEASEKREFAARTIRPKLQRHHQKFLIELKTTPLENDSRGLKIDGESLTDIDSLLNNMEIDHSVPSVEKLFRGGTSQARRRLKSFLEEKLTHYDARRNQPETDNVSYLAMHLHFGQISPLHVALKMKESAGGTSDDRDSFLEELLIRRELSQNFAFYVRDYDSYSCLPDWAKETLEEHRDDARPQHYTRYELESGETDDPYWNAAMKEMRETGYMHNYMRMYWGKKILEWTSTPEYGHRVALELNNKYFLDGRDANSFANIAWVFGNHDRAFTERPIFGKVRYMSAGGLKRKADADGYIEKVENRCASLAKE